MKKAYSLALLSILSLASAAWGHSSEIVHMHPHGENAYVTTWFLAAGMVLGVVLCGRYVLNRIRQK